MRLATINKIHLKGELQRAEKLYRDYLERKPHIPQAWFLMGTCLLQQERHAEAVIYFEKAIEMKPDFPASYGNLIIALKKLGRIEDAAEIISLIDEQEPSKDWIDTYVNAGSTFYELRDLNRARHYLELALKYDAENPDANWNLGIVNLSLGNYAEGWNGYEYGFRVRERQLRPYFDEYPSWDGEDLSGKTILIWGEQGLGDEILFAPCLNDLKKLKPKKIIFDCHPRLEEIFRRSFDGIEIHGTRKDKTPGLFDPADPDFHCPLGSLPKFFRQNPENFPAHGCLKPDQKAVAEYVRQIGSGMKVGISWRGGSQRTNQSSRSMSLEKMALALMKSRPDIRWVSLQYGYGVNEEIKSLKRNHGIDVQQFDFAIEDYTETANLVASCDLVISVITAVVHLGGALNVPVWCLTPYWAPWKFPATKEMPWHPSVTQYHQPEPYKWDSVLSDVDRDLTNLLQMQAAE